MANICILGSGGWGTALAVCAERQGHTVSLWSPFEPEIKSLKAKRQNPLLPGIVLNNTIIFTTDISALNFADLVIIAVPSFAVRETARKMAGVLNKEIVIATVSKGLEKGTLLRLSEVIKEELPNVPVVVLSGPSHAEEVARDVPTSIVASSDDRNAAEFVQDVLMSDFLRIYTNNDVLGVELGGAIKNVIAMGTGVADGLGLGDNTKAMLITRGLSEIARLGVKMGANEKTFAGLTGIGDLVVTCTSMHSRNRRFGILVGQGVSVNDALVQIGMTVEGYHATKTAQDLSVKYGVEMPIVNICYKVLFEDLSPKDAIKLLMTRPKKHETETPWL